MADRQADVLERIAAALERLAPPIEEPINWLSAPAYLWDRVSARPVERIDALPLDQLRGIDAHKNAVADNIKRIAANASAHDMLLWGARGMGKSALVRSAIASVQAEEPQSIALVQVSAASLASLPDLIALLSQVKRSFVLFLDDLGFGPMDAQANLALRSVLDGGVLPRPANIRLAVTSNRRAIIQRDGDEANAVHERDERDGALALADRFGLTLGFHPCDRATYLEIVEVYTAPHDLEFDDEAAVAWAINRGSRSGRTAYQFACELAGRAGIVL